MHWRAWTRLDIFVLAMLLALISPDNRLTAEAVGRNRP